MIIFDVEASGLSTYSYPIEIAWQDSEKPDRFDSFLIKPATSWTHWDTYAESDIHHISREMLELDGVSIEEACYRLNTSLSGKTIYSDAIEYDMHWIIRLYDEAGVPLGFNCDSIYKVLDSQLLERFENSIESETVTHRALEDVRQIIRLLFQEK